MHRSVRGAGRRSPPRRVDRRSDNSHRGATCPSRRTSGSARPSTAGSGARSSLPCLPGRREFGGEHVGCAIGRRVVHDDQLVERPRLRQQSPPGVGEYIREIVGDHPSGNPQGTTGSGCFLLVLCSPCPRAFCWRSANKLRASHASTSRRKLTWCAWLRTCQRSGQPILDTTGNEHCTIPGEMCRLGEFLLSRNRTRQVCGIRGVPGAARQRN